MIRRLSYSQRTLPATFEFSSALEKLQADGVKTMLGYLWDGFERFKTEHIDKHPPPTRHDTDLERDLTEWLFPYVQKVIPAAAPYFIHHERKERESAILRAQPPEPDLSFVFLANIRITFPIDAKVLEKDRPSDVTDYVATVNGRFLSCVYAPFSTQGAMIAFFLEGSVTTLLGRIRTGLGCSLSRSWFLKGRHHKTSQHERTAAACQHKQFTCHHMVMAVGTSVTG